MAFITILPYFCYKLTNRAAKEFVLKTPDDSNIGYAEGSKLKHHDNIEDKIRFFSFCPEKKKVDAALFIVSMNIMKLPNNKPQVICDWTHKTEVFTLQRKPKFLVILSMEVTILKRNMSFRRKPIFKEFLDVNTNSRAKANCKKL